MEPETGGELVRVSADEARLIHNFRVVNEVRQDALLFFSDELVKLQAEEVRPILSNVVRLTPR